MGDKEQSQFEVGELDNLEELDDLDSNEVEEDPVAIAKALAAKKKAAEEKHIKARREIERRNELKALRSELDEWDDLLDDDL